MGKKLGGNSVPSQSTMTESPIQNFYQDSNIFVTGGTGFLGKILLEKLLRDTKVDTIYLLVREKKGQDISSRIDDLFKDVVFSRLKSQLSKIKSKIKPIAGDASLPNLGLTHKDREILVDNVNIIFHAAATVNFNEPIKGAFKINVRATQDVLRLAREIKNLKVLMHVSTAYSNCNRKNIEEKIYQHPYDSTVLENILNELSEKQVNDCTERILGDWPNTYTFTKALAENCIHNFGCGLPLGIFRPSIVISTYKEPVAGWIDNLYGPTGVCMGALSGVIRVMRAHADGVSDMVPVDTCVAGLIASAWDVAERFNENNEVDRTKGKLPIYNFVSSVENPIKWNQFMKINMEYCQKYPSSKAMWMPLFVIVDTKLQATFLTLFLHYVPATFLDFIRVVTGKKPRFIKTYKKIQKFLDAIEYFATREWDFDNKNVQNLSKKLTNLDRELFPLSMKEVSWFLMFTTYMSGVRKYLLKDKSTLELALRRNERFKIGQKMFKAVFVFLISILVFQVLSKIFSCIFNIFL